MKVTIVVPTRERAATLRSTLETCIMQGYAPLEILVSDNFSEDDTREVVESFADPRIRYLNTGKRLSMTGNWEFALSHVHEGFVTFLGDDDGFLPEAIKNAMDIIKAFSLSALTWKKVEYHWPSYPLPTMRNLLTIPEWNCLIRTSSEKAMRDVASFLLIYNYCPCVYNSLVNFSVLKNIRRQTGRFFHSVIPDVYSGFAVASQLKSYFFSTRPFSVNGASGRSNGTSYINYFKNKKDPQNPTGQFLKENDLPLHPKIPVLVAGSVTASILEPLLQANDRCFSGNLKIGLHMAIRKAFWEISRLDPVIYQEAVRQIKGIFGKTPQSGFVRKCESQIRNQPRLSPPRFIVTRNFFETVMDASQHSVNNVYEASLLAHRHLPRFSIPATIHDYSRFFWLFLVLGPRAMKVIPEPFKGLVARVLSRCLA